MRRPRNQHLNGNPGSNRIPHGRNDKSDSDPGRGTIQVSNANPTSSS